MLNDIINELRDLKSTPRDLRNFGLLMAGVLGILALLLLRKHSGNTIYFAAAAAAFLLPALLFPRGLIVLYFPWMTFSFVLGWFMTRVILSITFFAVFTPMGLGLRMFRKDLLDIKQDHAVETYWKKHTAAQGTTGRYKRPF